MGEESRVAQKFESKPHSTTVIINEAGRVGEKYIQSLQLRAFSAGNPHEEPSKQVHRCGQSQLGKLGAKAELIITEEVYET